MVEASTGAGAVLRLIRGGATTRTQLALTTGLSRSTLAERVHALLVLGLVTETNGASTGGRPPATLDVQPYSGSRSRDFCVPDLLPGRGLRPRREALDRAYAWRWIQALRPDPACAPERSRRSRSRASRPSGCGRPASVSTSFPRSPSSGVRRRRARARRPAREPARPRRAVDPLARDRPPALRIRRREHRMRHRLPRQGPSRSARRRRRTRPHPRARVRGRALHVREHGLPGGRRRRAGAGRPAHAPRGCAPTRRPTSPRWPAAGSGRRSRPCGRPGARSARCSPSA